MTASLLQADNVPSARWKVGRQASGKWRFALVSNYGTAIIMWQHRSTKEACESAIALIRAAHDAPIEYNAIAY